MSTVHVVAKRDFLESLTIARPLAGLAELVWNGFDAGSDRVEVHLDMNRMAGIQSIRVRDYGHGINHEHVENLFGSLGDSWKKRKTRVNGRALHGKSGKGRFRAFALGTMVDWNTTYRGADQKSRSYRIRGQAISLDDFEIFDPTDAKPRGQISDDADAHITVWVKTWSEVINDARARLDFVNKQLSYQADNDTAKAYLKKAHEKFIPNTDEPVEDEKSPVAEKQKATKP